MKVLAWTLPAAIAVCGIAYSVSLFEIEDSKQRSFMMQACVSNGGAWEWSWGKPVCRRPVQNKL